MGKAKERLERLLEDLNASTGAIDPDGVPATVDALGDHDNDYPYSEFSSMSDVTGEGEGSDGEGGRLARLVTWTILAASWTVPASIN
jgi:hypothetical protein